MTDQPALFDAPAEPALTDRQQVALDAILRAPDGLYADEVGAWAHTIPGPRSTRTHAHDERCDFETRSGHRVTCATEGRRIGDKLCDLGLVRRRRGDQGRGLVYVPAGAPRSDLGETSAPPRFGTAGSAGFDQHGLPEDF